MEIKSVRDYPQSCYFYADTDANDFINWVFSLVDSQILVTMGHQNGYLISTIAVSVIDVIINL